MKMIKVESSNIKEVGYENRDLYIKFKNNMIYKYKNVPMLFIRELLRSESKGKYLNQNIKNKYIHEKIS